MALVAKTFLGQNLESHLFDPYATFELNTLFMLIITTILLIARALDAGMALFHFPMDPPSLRRMSVFCFCVGFAAEVFAGFGHSATGEASGGSIFPIAAVFGDLLYLGLITETIYTIKKTEGRSFASPVSMTMAGLALAISLAFNMREFFVSCLIAIVTTAFMYRSLRLQHIVYGVAFVAFFMYFLSPITLYLRLQREGMDKSQFVALVQDTVIKAATDPDFFNLISEEASYASIANIKDDAPYDYFGNRSNVLNRLSYIGLLDAVASATHGRKPLGMEAVKQGMMRNLPGFLGFEKPETAYGMGDWLSWRMDMGLPGLSSFLIFGLPMEGLATWGLIGFIVYPFICILPVLWISGWFSSFRLPFPASIFMFASLQHGLVESTADGFFSMLNRGMPMFALMFFIIHKALFYGRPEAKSASVAASTTN